MIPDFSLTGFDGTVLRSHGMLTKNQAKEKETVFFDGWFFFWGLPLALLARALPGNWGLWGLLAVSVGFLTEFPSPLKYLWLGINAASWLWQAGKSREWGSLPEAGLYVTLFSKAAGPWISWKDFRRQLRHPLTWDGFGAGCEMYIAGLGKVLVLARPLSRALEGLEAFFPVHFLAAALSLALGISGFLDAARGLSRMIGIRLGTRGWWLILAWALWSLPRPAGWYFDLQGGLFFLRNWGLRMALGVVCLIPKKWEMPVIWYGIVLAASVAAMMGGGL